MKKWEIIKKFKVQSSKFKIEDIVKVLLENRGLKTKKEIDEFLNPNLKKITIKNVGIDEKQIKKAVRRIWKAIKNKEQIIVYGDYDVDGICGTAILWETLYSLGSKVTPYIPHRIDEGYGLSERGILNVKSQIPNIELIITVDNGIVVKEAVEFANKEGIDVIITDHHVPSQKKPDALAIVHTIKLCGAGVAWALSNVILNSFQDLAKNKKMPKQVRPERSRRIRHDIIENTHLELVALATVADLVPLKGVSRTFLKYGLERLKTTKRIGLIELFKEAGIDKKDIGVYEIGHIIAPRLNAMGRLEYAMDSLRLLCTKDPKRAENLARKLSDTNRERQTLTEETMLHAKSQIPNSKFQISNLMFISHETYQQGVIGLVAGKLVEEFYRPAIVVSKGELYSKASARSISGFNIIEFIRGASEFLVDAGGHPMAAGFTVETSKLSLLQKFLEERAQKLLDGEKLIRVLKMDCELPLSLVDERLYAEIQKLSPFGMGNPEPVFVSRGLTIRDVKVVGQERKHLKLKFSYYSEILKQVQDDSDRVRHDKVLNGIAFGMGERIAEFKVGDKVDVVYILDENTWNGDKRLQFKIKDIKKSSSIN